MLQQNDNILTRTANLWVTNLAQRKDQEYGKITKW